MTYDEFNRFCGSLPATEMVFQWGGSYVWKVGGKVFAIGGWADDGCDEDQPAFTFKTSELVFENLRSMKGCRGAPYFAARGMKWIQSYSQPGLTDAELKEYLRSSYHLVVQNLTKKQQKALGLDKLPGAPQ